MQFKRVKLDEDRKSLLRYALSFYDDSDDIFPEFSFNPLSSVTDEVYNDCLRFFETNNADDNLVTFINNIIRCQTVYQFLCDKNEVSEIKINATDIPLFNTYLLESVSCSIALSKIYKMDPKTLLLYGFMRSNI